SDIRHSLHLAGSFSSVVILALGLASGMSAATTDAGKPVALAGRAMGTSWSVKFIPPTAPLEPPLVRHQIVERLEALEQQFSTYRANSTLSRFNAARHTDWFPVEPELAQVAEASRAMSELTHGAFDVTVFPLVRLWGFGGKHRPDSLPNEQAMARARALVDWRRLEVRRNPPALRKMESRLEADFSSMAKGFAADAISVLLTGLGAPNHLVQIGGDVKSSGSPSGGAGWRTGIEEPVPGAHSIALVVPLRGEALSTSGDYRNFFEAGGKRFGHIIDPRSGWPVSGSVVAVSVVHRSAAMSSALATALFVLGAEEGGRIAREQKLACLFQVRSGTNIVRHLTPEFLTADEDSSRDESLEQRCD
ncbi:MAG: FAD:protein FMN transferase, partial [Opitutaceae bacterium]